MPFDLFWSRPASFSGSLAKKTFQWLRSFYNKLLIIRSCRWNLTKSIWLSCGLICIRFRNLTNSNQFQITNFSAKSRDVFFVRHLRNLTKFEPKSLRKCQIPKTANNWSLSNYQNEARDRFFEEKLRIWDWFEFVKFRKLMHIRPHDNRVFQIDFVKFHCRPRNKTQWRHSFSIYFILTKFNNSRLSCFIISVVKNTSNYFTTINLIE